MLEANSECEYALRKYPIIPLLNYEGPHNKH
jgi:hypothetical protein